MWFISVHGLEGWIYIMKFYSDLLKLQRFADGGEGAGDGGVNSTGGDNGNNTNNTDGSDGAGTNEDTITFKDQSELDSWYDKKFAKSASKLKESWTQEQNQQKAYEDMTDAEKREFDDDKKEKALAAREQKLVIGENRASISEKLVGDGLPATLVKAFEPALSATDQLDDVYKAVTDSYREAVKTGVDKKLATSADVPGAGGGNQSESAGKSVAEARNQRNTAPKDNIWSTK